MHKIILLTLSILTLASCSAKKTSVQKFSFKVSAIQSGLPLNGGSFVRAISNTSNSLIKLDANDSAEFETGTWEFQTVSFEGPSAYAGRRFCGRAVGVNLSEAQKNVSLTITEANCYSEPFLSLMTLINTNFASENFLTISDIVPKGGPITGGSTVTIIGSGFVSGASVSIGGNPCSGLSFVNSTTLSCVISSHAPEAVTVTVTNPNAQSTSAANFYTYRASPVLNSLSPANGSVNGGATVTFVGNGFVPGATVMFGGAQCTSPIVNSSTNLTCVTPAFPAGESNVVITNPDGQVSSSMIFTYMPQAIINSVSPNNGSTSGGITLTISGTGLISATEVKIDSLVCTNLVVINSTQLSCVLPPRASGPVSITVNSMFGETSTLNNGFMYNSPPIIIGLNKKSGPLNGGNTVIINGMNFMTGAVADIGGAPCVSSIVQDPSTILCTTPSQSPGPKSVSVVNPDAQLANFSGFYTYRESFISTWQTSTASESITLPLATGLNYDFWVDWGDGSSSEITSAESTFKTHVYTTPGTYNITINGLVEGWNFNETPASKLKIKNVVNLGDMGWKNLTNAFKGCSNLTSFSGGTTNQVTTLSGLFSGATSLSNIDLSSFNTSNVTNMSFMFYQTSALTNLNIANLNTTNVTNMSNMFYGASSIININLSSFNTSMVTNMSGMFAYTNVLSSLNLSTFNTSNVTNMSMMFQGALALGTLDLSAFNTTNVVSVENMFNATSNLLSLNVTNWNIGAATNSTNIFANKNGSLVVTCNQGGTAASGTFFTEQCY